MDPYTYYTNLKLACKMEAENKHRLRQEEASSKRKKMAEVMSKLVSSETPQETSQGSISFKTLSQRSQHVYGGLSEDYFEMLKIHSIVNNDETSRLMEYFVR
jgi:hypothetical protein